MSRHRLFLNFIASSLVLGACAPAEEAAPAGPNVVDVVATEYAFRMPDTLPAGWTTFRLVGQGAEFHHAVVVRLEEAKTVADLLALPPGPLPAWAVALGGPNPPAPGGGIAETVLDLQPGSYAVVCFVPAADGMPHMMKGMIKAVTVVPSEVVRTPPTADLTMTLRDYTFELSAPPAAGPHVIRVVTAADAPQWHEVFLLRLGEGKTMQDMLAWSQAMEAGADPGPLPGEPLGGVAGLAPGHENLFPVNLTAGEYLLLCYLPDHADGLPHFAHGMVQQISVP